MTEQHDEGTRELWQDNPLHTLMGLVVESREDSYAKVRIELSDNVRGALPGSLHGGIMASLADVTSAFALHGSFEFNEEIPVTTDMHIRYYRQPKTSPVTAEARVVHKGRRLLSVECSITDGDDRQLARATGTYMIVPFNPNAASD